ncbi:uncharacterized protein LOC119740893 [Patiria miniata]|uniref:E2F/DP family winged-helix DNA-binding domain-containing protein n=1 Tax=Patiria miniata TaxID=46514 RepID=A0A914B7Z4_PATMI|nr:uncharacterized protein LOC119740893 [Patiria miniata]
MADLASSMSNFLFPEEFQPLDGCDEDELNIESFIMSSAFHDSRDSEIQAPSVSFQEPLENINSLPEVSHEVAVEMEPEVTPSTPNKPLIHLPCLSPLTPTANLKVLISAASPEIRVLDSRRQLALFNAIADHASSLQEEQVVDSGLGDMQEEVVEIECMSQGEDGMDDTDKPINRKSKSLGLLCQRFLSRYPDYPANGVAMAISLDAISKDLGVERRRIYDIVNVLESIEMVSRMAKNKYLWHGKMNMESTLARLKCLGEKKRYADQIAHLKKLQIQNEFSEELEQLSKQPFRDISNIGSQPQETEDKKDIKDKFDEDMNTRRDKSLGVMSQKFIMLFLVSQAKVITLDIAARVLIGDINYEIREGSKFKTKVRRLYDIANILTSLQMIQKVHVQEGRGRKPAFKWIGPNPDTRHVDPSDVCVENDGPSRQSFFSTPAAPISTLPSQDPQPSSSPASNPRGPKKVAWSRHASFNAICEVVERERRSYSSAPNSPTKDSQGDKPQDTPLDEKFRQDFEALRSKYPDQMSQIYVSNQQEEHGQGDTGTQSRACPSSAVPITSPICTPGNTAGVAPLNPKVIVSPIPGSLPVGTSRLVSSAIPVPLSFNVAKSDGGEEAVLSPDKGSVPSSSEGQAVLCTAATSSGQYSVLTDTVNALHVVLRQPDSTRRSKRTIKQPTSGEFEYQPVVKRSKMEVEAALALQRGHQDLPSQNQSGQTRYLKIPVDGKLLQQASGKPVQTIIIRKDVSVLNKNSSLPTGVMTGDTSGHPRGTVTATLVPGTIFSGKRLTAPQQAILINRVGAAPIKTVTVKHHTQHDAAPSIPQTATSEPNSKHTPELICTERLSDGEDVTTTTQLLFHEVASEQTSVGQGGQQDSRQLMKQTQDDKGLRLDKSKVRHRKTGIQRDACSKITNGTAENRMSPRQRGHHLRQKTAKDFKKPSSARALHLCPEFRNADVSGQSTQDSHSTEIAGECLSPKSAMAKNEPNEDRSDGTDNRHKLYRDNDTMLAGLGTVSGQHGDLGRERKIAYNNPGLGRNGLELNGDREETLAWPLHNSSAETPKQKVPVKREEQPQKSRPQRGQKSSKSLPCSPLALDASNHPSPVGSSNRPRSVASLRASEMDLPSFGSPRVCGGDNPAVLSVLARDSLRPGVSPVTMPCVAYLSPIQDRQLLSPFWKSSNSWGQFPNFPPSLPPCDMSDLQNPSRSPINFVSRGQSTQASSDHLSGFSLQGEGPSPSQVYPTLASFPNASPQNPHTPGMSRPRLSRIQIPQFSGSSFRPISRGTNVWPPRGDQCLTSPILPQTWGLGSLIPQTSSSSSETGTSSYVGYPCSQSTPVTHHQLLPHSLVPSSPQVTSQNLQYVSHSPSVAMYAPATVSGNGLVCISSPSVL